MTTARMMRLAGVLASGMVFAVAAEAKPAMSEAGVVRHVLPSIVNITILKAEAGEAKPPEQLVGSGFVVDPSGLILTNRHVIDGAEGISVTFADGSRARAELCAASAVVDLAMVKVTGRDNLPAVTWG